MRFHSPYPDVTIPEQPCSDYVFAHVSQWADTPAFIDGPSGRTLTFAEQDYRITHLYLVPPLVLALAKHPLVDAYDLSSVRYIRSAAAPLDGTVQQAVAARLQVPVVQGYGMTETSLAIAVTPPDPTRVKLGAVGVLLPNMEGTVVDPISGAELGPHARGELLVRGPNIMRGYLNNPEATRLTIDPGGWLHTGDIASVDDEGYLFVVDRLKELIKYKGLQVAPAELEGVLLTHPAIADAAVIGIPDAEAGEVPKAFVVLKASVTAEARMAYVASQVAPHKRIRQVEVLDAIPKSAFGKILRRVLVERDQAQHVGHTMAPSHKVLAPTSPKRHRRPPRAQLRESAPYIEAERRDWRYGPAIPHHASNVGGKSL